MWFNKCVNLLYSLGLFVMVFSNQCWRKKRIFKEVNLYYYYRNVAEVQRFALQRWYCYIYVCVCVCVCMCSSFKYHLPRTSGRARQVQCVCWQKPTGELLSVPLLRWLLAYRIVLHVSLGLILVHVNTSCSNTYPPGIDWPATISLNWCCHM